MKEEERNNLKKSIKNITLRVLFIFMACISMMQVKAQDWATIYTNPSNIVIEDIFSFGEDTLIAVGEAGTILYTSDGGHNWSPQSSGVSHNLYAIEFINDSTGYACGSSGIILCTSDGGSNWSPQVSGVLNYLTSIEFINDSIGYICGGNLNTGTILYTSDGGSSWSPQVSGVPNSLYSIEFINDSISYICGDNGIILYTSDGGSNWSPQASGVLNYLYSIEFVNNSTGYICGSSGIILYTSDGGNNWSPQSSNISGTIYDLEFINGSIGWGCTFFGEIIHTTTGGMGTCEVNLGNDTSICEGSSLVLDALPGYSYEWSNGDTTQIMDCLSLNSGLNEIFVEASKPNGCIARDTIFININSLPHVDLGPDSIVCSDSYISLDAGIHSEYLWSTGETSSTIDIDSNNIGLNIPTDITVTVTDANGCVGSDIVNIEFDICSLVNIHEAITNNINIYPNPTSGVINIKTNKKFFKFSIINSVGQTVYTREINNFYCINISHLPRGIYLLKIKDDPHIKRIIKY